MPAAFAYVVTYFFVCIIGHYLVAWCMHRMRMLVGLKGTAPFHDWTTALIGVTERFVALTLAIWVPAYLATFIGGWVLLKFALGWQRTQLNDMVARGSQLALIGTVLSFGIAILGGLYLNPQLTGALAHTGH
jgi:hypothetical protein